MKAVGPPRSPEAPCNSPPFPNHHHRPPLLLRPPAPSLQVRLEELRNVWQHVVRRRCSPPSLEDGGGGRVSMDDQSVPLVGGGCSAGNGNGAGASACELDDCDGGCGGAAAVGGYGDGYYGYGGYGGGPPLMKRKAEGEALQVQHEPQGANKKPRVVWSVEMHQQVSSREFERAWGWRRGCQGAQST